MSTHTHSTPTQPNSTDSPTPVDATPSTDRGPATFDPGCRRQLANLMDAHNEVIPRMGDADD